MTWLISKALMDSYEKWPSSQELEEESSEDICMDGEPCAQSSGNPIQLAYLPLDRMTKFSRLSQFGMTFRPLTADLGEDLLMWFQEAFLAKTYPQPEREQESPAVNQVCGNTWHELLMKYDPDSHSWKTVRCLFPEELQWSSVILPTWGMTVNGALFQHQTAVRPISGTGSGSLAYAIGLTQKLTHSVPTPTASDHIERVSSSKEVLNFETNKTVSLDRWVNHWPTPTASDHKGTSDPMQAEKVLERGYNHNLSEAIAYSRKWPTSTAHNAKERLPTPQATDHISKRTSASWKAKGGVNYSLSNPEIQMMWPTPRVLEVDESYENYISRMQKSGNPKNIGKTTPNNLTMAVNLWPTPAARDGNSTNTLDTLTEGRFVDQLANRVKMVENNIWATPCSRDWKGTTISKNHPNGFTKSLANDVIKCPTLTANEDACGKPTGKMQKMLGNHPEVRKDPDGGVLNADWVEWLMGWPIGWSKLEPLESFTEFDETWWDVEPVPRVSIGATARADRLKAIGNGQVPAVAATAWNILRKK